jgi:hypothetical protein
MKKKPAVGYKSKGGNGKELVSVEDPRTIDAQLEERFGKQEIQKASAYLERQNQQRQVFERIAATRGKQAALRDKLQKARIDATYGPEILRYAAGRRAIALVEELITAMAHAAVRSNLPGGIFDELGDGETVLQLARWARATFISIGKESGEFFDLYGKVLAKVQRPRQLHRVVIARILEAQRISDATEEVLRAGSGLAENGPDSSDRFDSRHLFHLFKCALKLDETTANRAKSNYSSFMRTLKEMEDEGLIPWVPTAKRGPKLKSK